MSNTTAVGYSALSSNTTGTSNTAVGDVSATLNTTGSNLSAFGRYALYSNTTGGNNTGVGFQSLFGNTTASNNTAVGHGSLAANTTASSNTAVGNNALFSNTTGSANVAVGNAAGYYTNGERNTFLGEGAGFNVTSGTHNTFIGQDSGVNMTTGSKNTILGKFNGNQGGLDIRTANNHIVLSDGDGNPRGVYNSDGDLYMYTSGSGIFIGGTATANKLDDYEEGTWTPAIVGSTGGTSTLTVSTNSYTKIGNTVRVDCYLTTADVTGLSGAVRLAGLPFSSSGYSPVTITYCTLFSFDEADGIGGFTESGDTYVNLVYGSSNLSIQHTSADATSGTVMFTVVYKTSA